jgi:SUMO ligase MMS21 Smc5/6 complex component
MSTPIITPQNIPLGVLIEGIVTKDPRLLDTLRAIEADSTNTQKRLQDLTINFNNTNNRVSSHTRWAPILMLMGG